MVRNYATDPVNPEAIDRIMDAARRAPSAGNSQGMSFVVITDPERRAGIARLAGEDEYVAQGFDPWISRAPVHVVVCVRAAAYHERYREPDKAPGDFGRPAPGGVMEWPVPYWWVDAGSSLMLLLLATVDEGLAAGFLGVHAVPDLKALLGIPDDVAPIGIVTLGHPAADRRSGSLARGRRPFDEVVHREAW
jgi:nitroreductase